ncbi:hypothetical protein IC006_2242 [Sulfuracidifex tepidarius]|uniref:Uncharacterized protein n=1 Tax=Sulfuracidifex tepidarius TaxID=1294262 RepID=A0A510DY75_9CREN|nr:hypothetical protein IC006_2242 [Sulfuracidifex tepidarius]
MERTNALDLIYCSHNDLRKIYHLVNKRFLKMVIIFLLNRALMNHIVYWNSEDVISTASFN